MTPSLTPQQREEVLEAMARAFRPVTSSDGSHTSRFSTEEEICNGWKVALGPALDAALPAIIGAVQSQYEALLADPAAVRVNMLRGGIARPHDLVWLHETNGPVAQRERIIARLVNWIEEEVGAVLPLEDDADFGLARALAEEAR